MDNIENEIDSIIENTTRNIYSNDANDANDAYDTNDDANEFNEHNDANDNSNDNEHNDINNESSGYSIASNVNSQSVNVFNIALHQYLKIEQEIKTLIDAIKQRNKTKRELAETLGLYLQTNKIKNVNLGGSYKGKKLETKITYSTKGFSKNKVTEILYEELKEEAEKFEKIMESIGKTNIITEKLQIKIISDKQSNKKIDKATNKLEIAEQLLNDNNDNDNYSDNNENI